MLRIKVNVRANPAGKKGTFALRSCATTQRFAALVMSLWGLLLDITCLSRHHANNSTVHVHHPLCSALSCLDTSIRTYTHSLDGMLDDWCLQCPSRYSHFHSHQLSFCKYRTRPCNSQNAPLQVASTRAQSSADLFSARVPVLLVNCAFVLFFTGQACVPWFVYGASKTNIVVSRSTSGSRCHEC